VTPLKEDPSIQKLPCFPANITCATAPIHTIEDKCVNTLPVRNMVTNINKSGYKGKEDA